MAGISAFRSDDARPYFRLYDAALATSTIPVTESEIETSFGRTHVLHAGDPTKPTPKSADLVAWLDEPLRALDIQRSAAGTNPHTTGRRRRLTSGSICPKRGSCVDDAGHNVPQDQPDIVEKLLADFLQWR